PRSSNPNEWHREQACSNMPPLGDAVIGVDESLDTSESLVGGHKRAFAALGTALPPIALHRRFEHACDLSPQLTDTRAHIRGEGVAQVITKVAWAERNLRHHLSLDE